MLSPESSAASERHMPTVAAISPRRQRERPAPPRDAFGFSVADTCRMTGLGRTTVYSLCKAGRLTFVKVNDRRMILGDSVRALLNIAA
jgi:hypothetical protein